MRLKHLELQGYKSFASRTEFAFDGGITAIVGPNGSGKSNVADAIRWVLGEQSYRTLRGKRTEDMIFAGSSTRARVGMASACLIFDNADGWLPIDFREVSITRRAYRSGENEYLLNGSRVRLRDISDLLARSGLARRTYTVVGQGLVDAVLSLRAEDRRELFEEAAGITLYQAKRAEALDRLDETRVNLVRINDIVNEIAPRVRRLEREAERAERHALLTRQLEGLLRTWYGYRWRQEQVNLQRTRDSLARREEAVDRRRQALDHLDERAMDLRSQQAGQRKQLGEWHKESGALHRRMEAVQRDLAVWHERERLLARQSDELEAELAGLDARAGAALDRVASARQEVADAQAALAGCQAVVEAAQIALDAHDAEQAAESRAVASARARVADLAAEATGHRSRLAQLREQRAAQVEAHAAHETAIGEQQAQVSALQAAVRQAAGHRDEVEVEVEALDVEAASRHSAQQAIDARRRELEATLADARRQVEALLGRYELLSRLRAEGEGLHAGVRALLRAAGADRAPLAGIVGTVAQHLHVPPEYEVALEVALGGHLQDVIVESWPHAEAAISFLREGRRGRVTFLPLDTVRPVQRLEVPRDPGVIGLGADLVSAEARLGKVVDMLLGHTLVVHDLPAARRVFDRLRGGFQIVTLSGDVLRSSGSVTGGEAQGQVHGQVLAREREWRELPLRVDEAEKRGRVLAQQWEHAGAELEAGRQALAELEARRRTRQQAASEAALAVRDRERELAAARQQLAWRQGELERLEAAARSLAAREAEIEAEVNRVAAARQEAEGSVADLERQLSALRADDLYRQLGEARTTAAVARGTWEHRRSALEELEARHTQLEAEIAAKRRRLSGLAAERASLAEQVRAQSALESEIQQGLSHLSALIEPAEVELQGVEDRRAQLEVEENRTRAQLRQAESGYSEAMLAHTRQQDRLERLRRQIMDDFGLVEMEPTEGLVEQRPLPMGDMVSMLPAVESLPEGLEDEVHQIKAQLRRMGAVNPSAPEEYAEVLDRHTFLTVQAADLEEAAHSLREVISELDEMMRREFLATFEAVAARFRDNFARLFGGGTARLTLTDPADVSQTGVEIDARPPGKRLQSLALLSGGERSLTAVALVFSILQVSPPPFCILDEVDAMLDEANVRRFREALEDLSRDTQFILITHNRGTIEAADTIYGVSMGEDSVSQVVSLRLEGERIAAPDGSTVEVKAG
ncbi:MAG TPA: chromosome segregation protein SMC [Anaerolineae bacterium]|nr:chromosome segregation protein SMC [Anaerolineae bacterium]